MIPPSQICMSTHNHIFVFHMFLSSSQDYLLHHLPRDQDQADQPVVLGSSLFLNIGVTKGSNAVGIKSLSLMSSLSVAHVFLWKRMKKSG